MRGVYIVRLPLKQIPFEDDRKKSEGSCNCSPERKDDQEGGSVNIGL